MLGKIGLHSGANSCYNRESVKQENVIMKYSTACKIFARLNVETFAGLINTRLYFTRARNSYGHHDSNGIGINPRAANSEKLTETIFHEMLHYFLDDVLNATDNGDHGFIFWAWYDRLIPDYITPDFTGIE